MKKRNLLAIWVLAAAVAGLAQQPTTTPSQQPATGDQANQPQQQKKEIKDPAEYNAYVNAIGLQDPKAKANALKQFIAQYPNSVVKEDAQEQLMAADQQAGNMNDAQKDAEDLVKTNPNHVRALLVLAYINRLKAQGGDITAAPLALKYGQQCLQALPTYPKPEGVSDADFQKLKSVAALVCNGAVGIGALNAKDYPTAQKTLQTAYDMQVSGNANDPEAWLNAYPLGTAYCSTKPPDVRGPWYAARAVVLTKNNPTANKAISDYAQHCYRYYHGDNDGWDQVLASANQPAPPPNLDDIIKKAPSPAEQVEIIAKKDCKEQSFDDWMQIITYGKPETVDRVWNTCVKGKQLAFQGKVVQAEKDKLLVAATYENSHDNPPKADTEVLMAGPIPPAKIPKVGNDVALVGTPESFDKEPFMFHMDQGKLAVQKGTAPATTHRPTRRARR